MRRRIARTGAMVSAAVLVTATAPALAQPGTDPEVPRDTIGPAIAITAPDPVWQDWHGGAVELSVRATDISGVEFVSYTLDGAQSGGGSFPVSSGKVSVWADGVTTITVTAIDGEGNDATKTHTVRVDATDPTTQLLGVANGARLVRGSLHALFHSCEDLRTGIASCATTPPRTSGAGVDTSTLGQHTITLTATDNVGRTSTRSLSYTVVEPELRVTRPPEVTGHTGAPRVGDILHVSGAEFEPAAESLTYRWVRGAEIVATGTSYEVTAADLGHQVGVQVTGHRSGHEDLTWGNLYVGWAVEGEFTVSGVGRLSGTATEGRTLRVTPPEVSPTPTSTTYEWTVGSRVVTTSVPTLALTSAMVGRRVSVRVGFQAPGRTTAWTPATLTGEPGGATRTAVVTGKAWKVLRRPAVTGTPRVGKRLAVRAPRLSGKAQRLTYQWLRNGKVIKGATGTRYVLRTADRGKRISVRVRATTPHRPATRATSPAVRIR
ncbi:hypothetical protein L615_001400000570 [Nocardioides sp. J9]|uniref:hypothetical protein n=1 Tax=unclassified Nocardioides TaxID=2615069 RepID=UPI00048D5EE4|nr:MULTISPECIES: hypothetical protein [unclassified Nocardioides]TWH01994.1 hypothetical protein L615_001400000570 [Nocardioides sp. J9]